MNAGCTQGASVERMSTHTTIHTINYPAGSITASKLELFERLLQSFQLLAQRVKLPIVAF